MTYSRHNWVSGDVVSAARLNNIEDGVQEAGGLARHTQANNTLDCSYNSLLAEVNAGKLPYLYFSSDSPFAVMWSLYIDDGYYVAEFAGVSYGNQDPDEPLVL